MNARTVDQLLSSRSAPIDGTAVVEMARDSMSTTTRRDLIDLAGRLSKGLTDAGLQRGDRVVIFAPNSAAWVASAIGIMRTGAVVVPLDTQMPSEDLAHALDDCEPTMVFTTSALRERLPEQFDDTRVRLLDSDGGSQGGWSALLASEPSEASADADDTAVIFYTSGTTGPPKGVPLTHANLSSNVQPLCDEGLADGNDRILVPLPFHHVYPFTVGILIPLTLGAPIIMPYSLVGPQIVRALREGEATLMLGVPRLYEAIWSALKDRVAGRGAVATAVFNAMLGAALFARQRLGLKPGRRLFAGLHRRIAPRLRLMVSGGAPLDPALGRRLQALGWEIAIGYGLSETSPILTINPPERLRIDSAGVALPNVELAIDGGDGPGTRGEVLARGPNVFGGYLNLPEKTREVLDEDGWFRTGDVGSLDRDGYLYLHGRESAMIVLSGGENVDPERVESALQAPEGIREVGVLEHQDRLAAVVVPAPELLREVTGKELEERLQELVKEAAAELPSHHRPGALRVSADPLPRTRLGKLRRHKLAELFDSLGEGADASGARAEPVSPESMAPEDQQLLSDPGAGQTWEYLAERFRDRRLTPDSGLARDLDIDSLSWVDLTLALRDRAGIDLDDSAIGRVETVRDLLREASAAGEAGDAGTELVTELKDPQTLIEPQHQGLLTAPGPVRRAGCAALYTAGRLLARALLRVEVRGEFPGEGPFLVAPRHLSALDPLVLLRPLEAHGPGTFYWAGLGRLLFASRLRRAFSRVTRILPIDPGSAPRSSLALAAACLAQGNSLVWFPEGRRSPDGSLQRLRPGIGLVLRAQPVPVVPVWIEGTREALPPGHRLPRPGRATVVIGKPIAAEALGKDEREIVETVHAALAALEDAARTGTGQGG